MTRTHDPRTVVLATVSALFLTLAAVAIAEGLLRGLLRDGAVAGPDQRYPATIFR